VTRHGPFGERNGDAHLIDEGLLLFAGLDEFDRRLAAGLLPAMVLGIVDLGDKVRLDAVLDGAPLESPAIQIKGHVFGIKKYDYELDGFGAAGHDCGSSHGEDFLEAAPEAPAL
jgi:hypothetical protein